MHGEDTFGQVAIHADPELLPPLRGWLNEVERLRGAVAVRRADPGPGEMGSVPDLLTVGLGSGGAGVALVKALCTWLVQRRSDVRLRVEGPGGRSVELDVKRARDPEAVLRDFAALFEPPEREDGDG